jgi:hypothetical protein
MMFKKILAWFRGDFREMGRWLIDRGFIQNPYDTDTFEFPYYPSVGFWVDIKYVGFFAGPGFWMGRIKTSGRKFPTMTRMYLHPEKCITAAIGLLPSSIGAGKFKGFYTGPITEGYALHLRDLRKLKDIGVLT